MRRILAALIFIVSTVYSLSAFEYTARQCEGSHMPYPVPAKICEYPDSLKPVFINHVGRHGSRFPSSGTWTYKLRSYLMKADSLGTITALGKRFLKDVNGVINRCNGNWGALDSLGMSEQRGIALRMYKTYPKLMSKGNISAIATYSPRVIQSMYSFTHELAEHSKNINIETSSGKRYSPLLRFFETDTAYMSYLSHGKWQEVYADYFKQVCPTAPVRRLIGNKFKISDTDIRDLALTEYYVASTMETMQYPFDYSPYFTLKEYNKLWSIFNLRQYLQRAANTLSSSAIDAAKPLLTDMIVTADSVLCGKLNINAKLRFAHAETIMPLLSLMEIPGTFYLTNYFDTVADNWKNFYSAPMAANIQLIYFTSPSGTIYVRGEYNEVPVKLIHGSDDVYVTWDRLREYLLNFTL